MANKLSLIPTTADIYNSVTRPRRPTTADQTNLSTANNSTGKILDSLYRAARKGQTYVVVDYTTITDELPLKTHTVNSQLVGHGHNAMFQPQQQQQSKPPQQLQQETQRSTKRIK
jgi:hypothetical protein